jgi:hypothetical protein
MPKIEIEWLSDESECDQAGCSGGYATGARVMLDGKPLLELVPRASCFGSDADWDTDQVYVRILQALGYEANTRYGD